MKKSLAIIPSVIIVTIVLLYGISPYFTNTTIDETLPITALPHTMEKKSMQAYSGIFVGAGDGIHDAQGIAKTVHLENGNKILRLEDFKSTNGPDLYVYLATDNGATEFINLGKLKANNGNQNYEIPEDANLEKYDKVLIWCKTFGVLFGNANLISQ